MNRTILQRRRQRERWKRLAVEMGPHPSLPPRWRRWSMRYHAPWYCKAWLQYQLSRVMAARVHRPISRSFDGDAGAELRETYRQLSEYRGGPVLQVDWTAMWRWETPAVYVQELRASGQADGGFLAGMLAREEGDDKR